MIRLVERQQAAFDGVLNSRRLVEVAPVAEASRAIKVLVCRLGVEQYAVIPAGCTASIRLQASRRCGARYLLWPGY